MKGGTHSRIQDIVNPVAESVENWGLNMCCLTRSSPPKTAPSPPSFLLRGHGGRQEAQPLSGQITHGHGWSEDLLQRPCHCMCPVRMCVAGSDGSRQKCRTHDFKSNPFEVSLLWACTQFSISYNHITSFNLLIENYVQITLLFSLLSSKSISPPSLFSPLSLPLLYFLPSLVASLGGSHSSASAPTCYYCRCATISGLVICLQSWNSYIFDL